MALEGLPCHRIGSFHHSLVEPGKALIKKLEPVVYGIGLARFRIADTGISEGGKAKNQGAKGYKHEGQAGTWPIDKSQNDGIPIKHLKTPHLEPEDPPTYQIFHRIPEETHGVFRSNRLTSVADDQIRSWTDHSAASRWHPGQAHSRCT
jgi:hypothetical protein